MPIDRNKGTTRLRTDWNSSLYDVHCSGQGSSLKLRSERRALTRIKSDHSMG